MKKALFFVGVVAALLASCTQEEASVANAEDRAIGFDVYTGTSVTRGDVENVDEFLNDGIGVFAFYQPANHGVAGPDYTTIKYPTPNFMYNQRITFAGSEVDGKIPGTWSYTPVKYWPNNQNDKLSFFAYAPYTGTTTWEDLGFSTDATGKCITKTFFINNEVMDQVDYLFAEPVTNKTKPTSINNSTSDPSIGKADVENAASAPITTPDDRINFNFRHVTSKVNLFVGVLVDNASNAATDGSNLSAWNDPNTNIEIKSIEFKDLAQTLTWTSNATPSKWSTAGKQNFVVKPFIDPDDPEINFGLISNGWTAEWHRYLRGWQLDDPKTLPDTIETMSTDPYSEYMFIAPQKVSEQKIIVTYVVTTTDLANSDNCSSIKNVIVKDWDDFGLSEFVAGKQYNLYFAIGMQSVKVAATVTDWEGADVHVLDVPTPNGN